MAGETYLGRGGVCYPVTPDVPTGLCGVCGERFALRADGTVKMHLRERRPGELIGTYWCDGGMPAGAR
jgi:hypothetical protein